jgi:hypothetical protein
MNVHRSLNIIQHVNWLVVCCLIIYFIFITGKPNWYLALKIGSGIQLALLLINWKIGIKSNWKWAIYDSVLVLMIAIFELQIEYRLFKAEFFKGYGFVYLSIFIVNILFLLSIRYIRYEHKMIR